MEYVLIWLLFSLATAYVARNRGENGLTWFFGGLLLGPIGLLFAFMTGTRCPKCRKTIAGDASLCPYCRSELTPSPPKSQLAIRWPFKILAGLILVLVVMAIVSALTQRG